MKKRTPENGGRISKFKIVGSMLLSLFVLHGDIPELVKTFSSSSHRIELSNRKVRGECLNMASGEPNQVLLLGTSSGESFINYIREKEGELLPGIFVSEVCYEWGLPVSGQTEKVKSGEWVKISDCDNNQAILAAPAWFNMLSGNRAGEALPQAKAFLDEIQKRCPGMKMIVFGAPPLPEKEARNADFKKNRADFNSGMEEYVKEKGWLYIDMEAALGSEKDKQVLAEEFVGDDNHFGSKGWGQALKVNKDKLGAYIRAPIRK